MDGKSSTRKSSKDLEMAAQNTPKITNWLRQVEQPGNAQYLGRRTPYGASKMLEWEGMGRPALEYHNKKEVMDRVEFKPEKTATLVEGSPVSNLRNMSKNKTKELKTGKRTTKVWTKLKSGLYGWRVKRQGVPKPTDGEPTQTSTNSNQSKSNMLPAENGVPENKLCSFKTGKVPIGMRFPEKGGTSARGMKRESGLMSSDQDLEWIETKAAKNVEDSLI